MSDSTWVYRHTETSPEGSRLYTVGFYDPDGEWHPEGDHDDPGDAARRVHYLNGGATETDAPGEGEGVYDAIRAERHRQDEKWGTSFPDRDWDRWVTILVEEVGEFAEAVLEMPYTEDGEEAVRKELVQIAAVAVSALTFGAPQGSQRGAGGDGIHEPTRERVEGKITAVNFHAGYAVVEVDLTEDELRELIHRRVRIIHEPTREEG